MQCPSWRASPYHIQLCLQSRRAQKPGRTIEGPRHAFLMNLPGPVCLPVHQRFGTTLQHECCLHECQKQSKLSVHSPVWSQDTCAPILRAPFLGSSSGIRCNCWRIRSPGDATGKSEVPLHRPPWVGTSATFSCCVCTLMNAPPDTCAPLLRAPFWAHRQGSDAIGGGFGRQGMQQEKARFPCTVLLGLGGRVEKSWKFDLNICNVQLLCLYTYECASRHMRTTSESTFLGSSSGIRCDCWRIRSSGDAKGKSEVPLHPRATVHTPSRSTMCSFCKMPGRCPLKSCIQGSSVGCQGFVEPLPISFHLGPPFGAGLNEILTGYWVRNICRAANSVPVRVNALPLYESPGSSHQAIDSLVSANACLPGSLSSLLVSTQVASRLAPTLELGFQAC